MWQLATGLAVVPAIVGGATYAAQNGGTYASYFSSYPFANETAADAAVDNIPFRRYRIWSPLRWPCYLCCYLRRQFGGPLVPDRQVLQQGQSRRRPGFYYMANAGGRLIGTLISGFLYEATAEDFGLAALLWISSAFFVAAAGVSCLLRSESGSQKYNFRSGPCGCGGRRSISLKLIYFASLLLICNL